jgi:superfamily II DNA or RNA helicase
MDWVKSGEGLRAMRDVLPAHTSYPRKFDMLVVDEAHNIALAAGANYALESQRTRFIRSISPHFQHRLFLTATLTTAIPNHSLRCWSCWTTSVSLETSCPMKSS